MTPTEIKAAVGIYQAITDVLDAIKSINVLRDEYSRWAQAIMAYKADNLRPGRFVSLDGNPERFTVCYNQHDVPFLHVRIIGTNKERIVVEIDKLTLAPNQP